MMMPLMIAFGWKHIGPHIIKLSAAYPVVNRTSIGAADLTLIDWLGTIAAAN
jgi:hypothetical protein